MEGKFRCAWEFSCRRFYEVHARAREVIFVIRETMRPSKGNFARDEVLAGHKWNDLFFLLYGERGGRDFFSRGLKILDGLVNFNRERRIRESWLNENVTISVSFLTSVEFYKCT